MTHSIMISYANTLRVKASHRLLTDSPYANDVGIHKDEALSLAGADDIIAFE